MLLRRAKAEVSPIKGSILRDRLLEAKTPEAKFHVLEQTLLAQAARPLDRHPAVSLALKEFQSTPQPCPISAVVEDIGLSQRRFIQLFSEEVGLTPKLFCRIQRFQEVLCLFEKGIPFQWAEIALACGYFDQAHFIHDFQAFSGLNPITYLAQRGQQHRNHVPIQE
jgi:transcriptional regulator GlxA family with amidase domain